MASEREQLMNIAETLANAHLALEIWLVESRDADPYLKEARRLADAGKHIVLGAQVMVRQAAEAVPKGE